MYQEAFSTATLQPYIFLERALETLCLGYFTELAPKHLRSHSPDRLEIDIAR